MLSLIAAAALQFSAPQIPDLPPLPPIRREAQVTYVDRSGSVIGVRGGRYAPPIDLARLPAHVPAAFIAIEDRRFFEHQGFDPVGIGRAIMNGVSEGRLSQGASTITQQLARNLYLTPERTAERKARELLIAIQLEQTYSKRQILGLYLSRVYYGAGAYGLEAASRRYFNKTAAQLSLQEAATLAGILKSPTAYNPIEHPKAAVDRARLVLNAMVETGAITPAQRARALEKPLKVWAAAPAAPAQYFVDWLETERKRLAPSPKQDLIVETTLDMGLERAAADAARSVVLKASGQKVGDAAVVMLDGLGRVRVMVGGADYARSPFNRAVTAKRQAGSAWKPFVYLAALEAGWTPDMPVVDEPVTIGTWTPQNYTDAYLGQITLETALAQSVNTVAARLADQVGRANVAAAARRVGVVSTINTEPAMALGTTQVSALEMAQAYGAFGNGGRRVNAYGIERIRAGKTVIYQRRAGVQPQVVANPALGELNRMMRSVVTVGTGRRAAVTGYDIAGKTGTTSDYKDAWFAGYSGGLTAVVWMGRDDAAPMVRVTGGGPPAELWRAAMLPALKRQAPIAIPAGPAPPEPEPPPPVVDEAPDPIGEIMDEMGEGQAAPR